MNQLIPLEEFSHYVCCDKDFLQSFFSYVILKHKLFKDKEKKAYVLNHMKECKPFIMIKFMTLALRDISKEIGYLKLFKDDWSCIPLSYLPKTFLETLFYCMKNNEFQCVKYKFIKLKLTYSNISVQSDISVAYKPETYIAEFDKVHKEVHEKISYS
jgi:hypothetical protein